MCSEFNKSDYLEVHDHLLALDTQHQVTQDLVPSELIHGQERSGCMVLNSVVKISGPPHGGNDDGREIRVTSRTFPP